MKAIVQDSYGAPGEVLRVEEIAQPAVGEGEVLVLVRVRAASVNVADTFVTTGQPKAMRPVFGLLRPRARVRGHDFAGVVERVGPGVTHFQPGDEVYGSTDAEGAFAEWVRVGEDCLAPKPVNLDFEQAAAVPMGALTALHGLRDAAAVKPGQRVLINGASGGVGAFAVQVARLLGAEVTGVCSGRNVELVRSLGADHVIDYTQEDFTKGDARYDVILDNVGNHPLSALRGVLTPEGTLLPNSGTTGGEFWGPFPRLLRVVTLAPFVRQKLKLFVSMPKREDLLALKAWIEGGALRPVIDRAFPLDEAAQAIGYVGEGHARGKVVLTV